jgi:hypothetical protein
MRKDRAFTAIKIIKKSRTKKVCRGCGKEIPIGSSYVSVYELLGCRYSNDCFHDIECIKEFIYEFFENIKLMDDWMADMIEKSLKKK